MALLQSAHNHDYSTCKLPRKERLTAVQSGKVTTVQGGTPPLVQAGKAHAVGGKNCEEGGARGKELGKMLRRVYVSA